MKDVIHTHVESRWIIQHYANWIKQLIWLLCWLKIKKIEFNQMKLIIELSKTCLPKTFISKQLPCVHASGEKRNFFLQRLHEKQNSYSYWNLSVSSYTHVWLCLLFSLQYPMLQMQQVWHMWANKDVQTHTYTLTSRNNGWYKYFQ